MGWDVTITDFNICIIDIASESFALGEKISLEKSIQKILHSLPKCFNIKVTTIENANDISTMKMDELFGSLHTFELMFDQNVIKRIKV